MCANNNNKCNRQKNKHECLCRSKSHIRETHMSEVIISDEGVHPNVTQYK